MNLLSLMSPETVISKASFGPEFPFYCPITVVGAASNSAANLTKSTKCNQRLICNKESRYKYKLIYTYTAVM